MSHKPFDLQAQFKFRTPGLDIQPELVGAIHRFKLDENSVQISLPKLNKLEDKKILSLSSWQEDGDERIPIGYSVGEIEVTLSVAKQIALPISILERQPNAYEIVSSSMQDELKSIAASNTQLAEKAVSLWSRTMRWKTGDGYIARGEFKSINSGWGATLLDVDTKKRLWTYHEPIVLFMTSSVKTTDWELAGKSLADGEEPPVFIDIFFDAQMHLRAGDLRRALVDIAVAAETYIRHIVLEALPSDLSQSAKDLIDRTSISQLMEKLFFESLERLKKSEIASDVKTKIRELFKARNSALHRGKLENIDKETCTKYIDAVRGLLGLSKSSHMVLAKR